MLVHLISDLSRNHHGVSERFARDPLAVLAEYGLSREEMALLTSRDVEAIVSHVGHQTRGLLQALAAAPRVDYRWPGPKPVITAVSPSTARVDVPTQLTVLGSNFIQGATLQLIGEQDTVTAEVTSVQSGPNSVIEASVKFATAGWYSALVHHGPSEQSVPFDRAISVS